MLPRRHSFLAGVVWLAALSVIAVWGQSDPNPFRNPPEPDPPPPEEPFPGNTNPFGGSINPFRTPPSNEPSTLPTEVPFPPRPTTTTEDPFRTPPVTFRRTNDDDDDRFSNNDRPSTRVGRPRTPTRLDVDEYGNPLREINYISKDPTGVDFGENVDASEIRCPRYWERFRSSCYKFTRSPIKNRGDAESICRAFRHQDEVLLLSSLLIDTSLNPSFSFRTMLILPAWILSKSIASWSTY